MSSRFYFGGSDSGSEVDDDDDDATSLPFPKPIDRAAFLAADFDATEFLSGLSNRFQTLEDLQAELRELSQSLNNELVNLVNHNYQDFLSLGNLLSGGEEKVEDIRVDLLGFQRDITAVRDKVDARSAEIVALLQQKRELRQETGVGRALLEIADLLDQLEEMLNTSAPGVSDAVDDPPPATDEPAWSAQWRQSPAESDDEYNLDDPEDRLRRLKQRVDQVLILRQLVRKQPPTHPFLLAQGTRLRKIHDAMLSEIDGSIRQEPEVKSKQALLQLRAEVQD